MLPTKKDHPCVQEQAPRIWHVPETVPSWHVPEKVPSWHVPVSQPNEKERENLSPDAGQRAQRPVTPNTQPLFLGVKTKASMKEIPTRQFGELSTVSSGVPKKRPIPTVPWKDHPSAPRKRPIPTIPPGGTLLETSPIYQPIPTCDSGGETSSFAPKIQEKSAELTSSKTSATAPSTTTTMHEGPSRNGPLPLTGGPAGGCVPSLDDAHINRPILTGESVGKPSTSPTPKGGPKSGKLNNPPSKMTARKSTTPKSSVIASSTTTTTPHGPGSNQTQPLTAGTSFDNAPINHPILTGDSLGNPSTSLTPKGGPKSGVAKPSPTKTNASIIKKRQSKKPRKLTSDDDAGTSSITDKFILTTPPELKYKGEPPRWIRALYLEPLLDGWKREVRERATATKRTFDVYYYSPDGRRFRSRVEVGKYLLDEGITKYSAAFNFSFRAVILGGEFEPYELLTKNKKRETPFGTIKKPLPPKSTPPKKKRPSQVPLSGPETIPELVDDMDYSEEGMVFDEEIEVVGTGDGQDPVFDPAVLSLRNQPVAVNMPEVTERHGSVMPSTKQHQLPSTSKAGKHSGNPANKQLFCICDDVEHGDMVLCDNIKCEIGWYHFGCVNIRSAPAGTWFCPICRGASSDVINPSIALGK